MRLTLSVFAAMAIAVVVAPGTALANHHACPQVTTATTGGADVSRKDCSPVYVPYPVGGPKSPLPSGAYQSTGLPLPAVQTPYPDLSPSDDNNPPDVLGCYGPDLGGPTRTIVQPLLGTPQNSDPADPYVCPPGFKLIRIQVEVDFSASVG
jgi:hypothetical protein